MLGTGDINIAINQDKLEEPGERYLALMAFHGLLPAHTLVTRDKSGTCIDHVFLRTKLPSSTIVAQTTVTDHKTILFCVECKPKRIFSAVNHNKIDKDAFKKDIMSIDFEPIYSNHDPEKTMTYLCEKIHTAIVNNTITKTLPKRKRIIKPWITAGLLKCIKNRDRLHKKHKNSPNNEIIKLTYTRYRNYCNSLLKKLKRIYERNLISKAGNNNKKIWEAIKDITNTSKNKTTPNELLKLAQTPEQSLNEINKYFINVGKKLAEEIEKNKNIQNTNTQLKNTNSLKQNLKSFVLLPTDEIELEGLLLGLKNDSAPGLDKISNKLLKDIRSFIIPPLTHIFNNCIDVGVFPEVLKRSAIVPIHKKGDKDLVSNYRPISILPSLSKLLEKILNTRLIGFLENNNLLSENQFGFRKGRSANDAVLGLTEYISTNLDNNKKVITIFLDLAKAFDTVSVPLLLTKLEAIGVRDKEHKLFQSYLSNRYQRVRLGNHISSELPISFGVPQGSILGPSLFLVYINDLLEIDQFNGKIISYADDTALSFVGRRWDEVHRTAQSGFDYVNQWLHDNILTLNIEKSKYITFSIRAPNYDKNKFNIVAHECSIPRSTKCSCSSLENVTNIKYLGIVVDQNLSFQDHIEMLSGRVRKLIYVFKNLRHVLDPSRLKQTYLALCQSILTYGITSWGGASKTLLKKLEVAQRAVLKVCTFKPFLFPTTELYSYCEVLTVRQLFLLAIITKQHSAMMYDPFQAKKRRNHIVCHMEITHTAFSKMFFKFLGPYIYNKVNKTIKIHHKNLWECKHEVKKWLQQLTYDETEKLISVIV